MSWSVTNIFGVIFIIILLYRFYIKYVSLAFRNSNKVSLVGKTVLVTGANTGMGYEYSLECAKRGARVILACLNESEGLEAAEKIKRLTQNPNVIVKVIDLGSMKSVHNCAKDILEHERNLDILINNAGTIMHGDKFTEDGLQLEMSVNYFGPTLFTLLLLDLLKKSSTSRIINVASKAAQLKSNLTPQTLNTYMGNSVVYSNSKLGNILFTQELAKKLKSSNVSVFSVHPGAVYNYTLHLHFKPIVGLLARIFTRIIFVSPEEGTLAGLYTAMEPGLERLTGNHFEDFKVVTYTCAKDPFLAKQIWDATMKLIKFDDKNI